MASCMSSTRCSSHHLPCSKKTGSTPLVPDHTALPEPGIWPGTNGWLQFIQSPARREEQQMFEAIFRMTALVKSDGYGQRVFRVTKREAAANDAEFLFRLA